MSQLMDHSWHSCDSWFLSRLCGERPVATNWDIGHRRAGANQSLPPATTVNGWANGVEKNRRNLDLL